jgi:hypothetical protein
MPASPSSGNSAPASPAAGSSEVSGTARPPSSVPAASGPSLTPPEQQKLDRRLVLAAKANDAALVGQLIREGGNVNAKDSIQDSAFLYAGAEGFNEILRLTLANGADVRSTNRFGGTALIPASEHGHVETVRILIAAGVPVNRVNKLGWTAMQEAILLNNEARGSRTWSGSCSMPAPTPISGTRRAGRLWRTPSGWALPRSPG